MPSISPLHLWAAVFGCLGNGKMISLFEGRFCRKRLVPFSSFRGEAFIPKAQEPRQIQ